MALAYLDDGEPSSVSHCRAVLRRHGRAFSAVLGCVLPLLDHCSFFLGFLQKIRLCTGLKASVASALDLAS